MYCFRCHREMKCLKSGFIFDDGFEIYVTDLFMCEECMGLCTNRQVRLEEAPATIHFLNGFTDDFMEHVRRWYPHLYDRFTTTYRSSTCI